VILGGRAVLRLADEQVESLFDVALPVEVRELPADLARLGGLLSDQALLAPIAARWERSARERRRPTIAMAMFVRLMVIQQRTGWGYETLVREVSDSLHLRRFVGVSLTASVPHESTIGKLARRLGAEVIEEITRLLIGAAMREKRFAPRAVRVDSTVVEADVGWPSDAALAHDATRVLAREGARVRVLVGEGAVRVRDRSRAAGRRLRLIGRTVGVPGWASGPSARAGAGVDGPERRAGAGVGARGAPAGRPGAREGVRPWRRPQARRRRPA
jgi:transposase, IS5 family